MSVRMPAAGDVIVCAAGGAFKGALFGTERESDHGRHRGARGRRTGQTDELFVYFSGHGY